MFYSQIEACLLPLSAFEKQGGVLNYLGVKWETLAGIGYLPLGRYDWYLISLLAKLMKCQAFVTKVRTPDRITWILAAKKLELLKIWAIGLRSGDRPQPSSQIINQNISQKSDRWLSSKLSSSKIGQPILKLVQIPRHHGYCNLTKQFANIARSWKGYRPRDQCPSDVPWGYNESISQVDRVSKQLSTQQTKFDCKHRPIPPTSHQFVDEKERRLRAYTWHIRIEQKLW